jgi:hypothetical protein
MELPPPGEHAHGGAHGFLLRGDELRIDYAPIVLRNITTLHNCFESIERSAPNYQNQDLIGLYLAFFQEIRYELPPDKIDKREIMGLYVPTEVVIHDHGDCDSKSLAFSAMIRSLKIPLIVIRVPGHVLVGVESRPGPNQKFVRLGNRYFVLCEVAGPAKLFPGEEGSTRVQGNFEYTLIEPA